MVFFFSGSQVFRRGVGYRGGNRFSSLFLFFSFFPFFFFPPSPSFFLFSFSFSKSNFPRVNCAVHRFDGINLFGRQKWHVPFAGTDWQSTGESIASCATSGAYLVRWWVGWVGATHRPGYRVFLRVAAGSRGFLFFLGLFLFLFEGMDFVAWPLFFLVLS